MRPPLIQSDISSLDVPRVYVGERECTFRAGVTISPLL
jgi:hypothetical protein